MYILYIIYLYMHIYESKWTYICTYICIHDVPFDGISIMWVAQTPSQSTQLHQHWYKMSASAAAQPCHWDTQNGYTTRKAYRSSRLSEAKLHWEPDFGYTSSKVYRRHRHRQTKWIPDDTLHTNTPDIKQETISVSVNRFWLGVLIMYWWESALQQTRPLSTRRFENIRHLHMWCETWGVSKLAGWTRRLSPQLPKHPTCQDYICKVAVAD